MNIVHKCRHPHCAILVLPLPSTQNISTFSVYLGKRELLSSSIAFRQSNSLFHFTNSVLTLRTAAAAVAAGHTFIIAGPAKKELCDAVIRLPACDRVQILKAFFSRVYAPSNLSPFLTLRSQSSLSFAFVRSIEAFDFQV